MADPLSIAASIAGLITIADIVVRNGYKFLKSVHNAEKNAARLLDEVNTLSGILHSLRNVAERYEDDNDLVPFDPTMKIYMVHNCYETIQKLYRKLQIADPKESEGSSVISKKLKWPFTEKETKKSLEEIATQRSVLNDAVTADSMQALLVILRGQDKGIAIMSDIKHGLAVDRIERRKVAMTETRSKILSWICPRSINPRTNQKTNIRLRQPGTGLWFTEGTDFRNWLSMPRSRLWLYGIPGAGKSILTSAIIQDIQELVLEDQENGLAFFYCDHKNIDTQKPLHILGALVEQLAATHEQNFVDLEKFYQAHDLQGRTQAPDAGELCELIRMMGARYSATMIVIDALDEIAIDDRADIIKLLCSLNNSSGSIKTLFTSRGEIDIEDIMQDYNSVSIAAQSSDLRLYVASEIDNRIRTKKLFLRSEDLKNDIMLRLVDGADGMFRWVACQMDYLCNLPTDSARRKALENLPPDLPGTYTQLLRRLNSSAPQAQELVKRTLVWLVLSHRQLCTNALLQAISMEVEDTSFDTDAMPSEEIVLKWCSSLIRRSADLKYLELAHFTVEEFLLAPDSLGDPVVSQYCINKVAEELYISRVCLKFLTLEDITFIPEDYFSTYDDDTKDHEFITYASDFWWDHTIEYQEDEIVMRLLRSFFILDNAKYFTRWVRLFLPQNEDGVPVSRWVDASPLHLAACFALDKLCMWLLNEGCDVNCDKGHGTALEYTLDVSKHNIYTDLGIHPERRISIIKLLLKLGVTPKDSILDFFISDHRNDCFFSRSSQDLEMEVIRMFLKAGAKITSYHLELLRKNMDECNTDNIYNQIFRVIEKSHVYSDDHEEYAILAQLWRNSPQESIQSPTILPRTKLLSDEVMAREVFLAGFNGNFQQAICWLDQLKSSIDLSRFHQILWIVFKNLMEAKKMDFLEILLSYSTGFGDTYYENYDYHDRKYYYDTLLTFTLDKAPPEASELVLRYFPRLQYRPSSTIGDTPLHLATVASSYNNDTNFLWLILERSRDRGQILARNDNGETPLGLAIGLENLSVIETLIDFFWIKDLLPHFSQSVDNDNRSIDNNLYWDIHMMIARTGSTNILDMLFDKGLITHENTDQGYSLLHCAALAMGHIECFKYLLAHDFNPAAKDKDGRIILHILCRSCYLENSNSTQRTVLRKLEVLFEKNKYGINLPDKFGSTPLHHLCKNDLWEETPRMLELLVENGGDPTIQDATGRTCLEILLDAYLITESSATRHPILDIMMCYIAEKLGLDDLNNLLSSKKRPLSQALSVGAWKLVEVLLSRGVDVYLPDAETSQFDSLHVSCLYDCPNQVADIFKSLAKNDINYTQGVSKRTLLHVVSSRTLGGLTSNMLIWLLENSADLEIKDKYGMAALHVAIDAGNYRTVSMLLDAGANIEVTDGNSRKPIHLAISKRSHDICQLLVDAGACLGQCATLPNGQTSLQLAIQIGNKDLTRLLLSSGADMSINSINRGSLLHHASVYMMKDTELLELIYDADKAHMEAFDKFGLTPLSRAAAFGNETMFEYLLDKGASLEHRGSFGNVVTSAARAPNTKILQHLFLLKNVNWTNKWDLYLSNLSIVTGCIAVHAAASSISDENLKFLKSNNLGFNVNALSDDGFTPLHFAAAYGRSSNAKLLLDHGATADVADSISGSSPLHLAAEQGHDVVVTLLLDQGCDATALNFQGESPESLARENKNFNVVSLLQTHVRKFFGNLNEDRILLAPLDIQQQNVRIWKLPLKQGSYRMKVLRKEMTIYAIDEDEITPAVLEELKEKTGSSVENLGKPVRNLIATTDFLSVDSRSHRSNSDCSTLSRIVDVTDCNSNPTPLPSSPVEEQHKTTDIDKSHELLSNSPRTGQGKEKHSSLVESSAKITSHLITETFESRIPKLQDPPVQESSELSIIESIEFNESPLEAEESSIAESTVIAHSIEKPLPEEMDEAEEGFVGFFTNM